uniref:hypothetical protein n=1 Tax=Flavobacterium sp. TaxID=239 RepID=UPI00404AA7B1
MKTRFSTPKIFTGGVDIRHWNKLSAKEKKEALSKEWFVYYSFRNPKTGKLKRMSNIKGDANKLKSKEERLNYLVSMRDALQFLLEKGFNPYEINDVDALLYKKEPAIIEKVQPKETKAEQPKVLPITLNDDQKAQSIKEAFDFALRIVKFRNVIDESCFNFDSNLS